MGLKKTNNLLIVLFIIGVFASCKDNTQHHSFEIDKYLIDSIVVYKYTGNNQGQGLYIDRIEYHIQAKKLFNTPVLFLKTKNRTVKLNKTEKEESFKHEVDDLNSRFNLNNMINYNKDIIFFNQGVLYSDKDSVSIYSNSKTEVFLFLDNKEVSFNDTISLFKTIDFKPLSNDLKRE